MSTQYLRITEQHAPTYKLQGYDICRCGKLWPCVDSYATIDPPKLIGLKTEPEKTP